MAFASSPGNTIATLPSRQSQQKSIAEHPTRSPENSMGFVEEINEDVLLIQAFLRKASEVQDQVAQIEHEQASFSSEILSLECRIRALEEYYFASASTLGKRSRGSCESITADTQTEKVIDCPSDQHHTHVTSNGAHIPLCIAAAEFNPKESSETFLPASPRRNYADFLLESTLESTPESPSKTNGQLMQTPQQDVITSPAHDVSTEIDVVPEPGASESLSGANVDLGRVWAVDSTNPSEAGSDPELELQYPSDADLELELELSRMAPNVPSSEPNICLGCKRTFSCQDALTRHLKSQGSAQGRQTAETESADATSACLMATTSKKRKLEEAFPTRNAWGTLPTASIADREIVLPPRPADTGACMQPATPSIDNYQSLDVDSRATLFGVNTEANGTWGATNHFEASTHSHETPNAREVPFRCPWCSKEHESSGDTINHIDLEHAWSALYIKSKRRRFRLLAKPADLFNIDVMKFSLPGALEYQ